MVKNTNDWTGNHYHNDKGKILGSVSDYNGQHKALLGNFFIGWYISENHARIAVEEAWEFENNKSTNSETEKQLWNEYP